MGFIFVIILHLIALAILSGIIAAISAAVILIITKNNEQRKKRIFLAASLPFHFFFTLYILAFAGTFIVSEIKDVDMGFGDSYYVPVNETCSIQMIDVIENAYLDCSDQTVISGVSRIFPTESKIYGEKTNGKFFCYELSNAELRTYSNFSKLTTKEKKADIELIEIGDYYHQRRNEVAGTATIIVGIIALILTIMSMLLIRKTVLATEKK